MAVSKHSPDLGSARRRLSATLRQRGTARSGPGLPRVPGRRMALPAGRTLPWLLTGLLFLGCIALLAWGFGLRSDLDAAHTLAALREQELARVRLGANATAYTLVPTAAGPEMARGTAFLNPEGSGVLQITNLPALDAARAYQLWFFPEGDQPPIPGDTFTLNADGIAFSLIPADVGPFQSLGVSAEPTGGSREPTGQILLIGTVGGARG